MKLLSVLTIAIALAGCAGSPLWLENQSKKIASGEIDPSATQDYRILCRAVAKTGGKDQKIIDALKNVKSGNLIRIPMILNKKNPEPGMYLWEAECLDGFVWEARYTSYVGKSQIIHAAWDYQVVLSSERKRMMIVDAKIETVSY